jgi:formylglycine-generating enzyme required for sulfatase activity
MPATRQRNRVQAAWLRAVLCLSLPAVSRGVAAGQLAAAAAPTNFAVEPVETVLNVHRGTNNDCLRLAEGSEVRATVANPLFLLHTAYGSFPIDTRFIAAVVFDADAQHLDTILTVNRNRLTGFVNDEIQIQTASGTSTNLPKDQVRQVVFRLRDTEDRDARTHQFVILDNGDLLSGEFKLPRLLLTSPGGARPVDAAEVETIRFEKGLPGVQVQLTNGDEAAGQCPEPAMQMRLDCGPEITLPRRRLKALYARPGFVPVEVRQVFDTGRAAQAKASPEPGSAAPPGLVWIPPGRFLMGSPSDERGRGSDEDPQTEVTISRGFWMGQHEVTQGEYLAVMGSNPSQFQGDTNQPAEKVSWNEAREYCARLTEGARRQGTLPAGYVYRLPTEAEWEYACRAGTTTRFSYGDDPSETGLSQYAWFIGNSDLSSHPVGQLKPNPWGLYDMHGNVWEWCLDIWTTSYPGGSVTDYLGAGDGWLRVARGGSWLYTADFSRSANRDNYGPDNRCSDIGFRVVLAPPRG